MVIDNKQMEIEKIINDPILWGPLFEVEQEKTEIPQEDESQKILHVPLGDGNKIGGYFHPISLTKPTICVFHGCMEQAKDYKRYLSPLFHGAGANFAVFDYRGFGFSTGMPSIGSVINDALPCYQYLEQHLLQNNYLPSIYIYGRSTGGNAACEIGRLDPSIIKNVHGVIFESSFANFFEFISKGIKHPLLTEENFAPYDNYTKLPRFTKPTLIVHGGRDVMAPPSQSETIFNLLPENIFKKRVCLEKADHTTIILKQQLKYYLPILSEFIAKYQ